MISETEAIAAPFAEVGSFVTPVPIIGGRALPQAVDDAERDLGPDLYDKMGNEPCLFASDWLIRALVLEPGLRVMGAISKPDRRANDPEELRRYALSERIADFVRRNLEDLEAPTMDDALWHALDAFARGHRLLELTHIAKPDVTGETLIHVKTFRPKGRRSYRLIVDKFGDLLGAQPSNTPGGWRDAGSFDTEGEVLTPERFVLLSIGGKDGDPRGRAAMRACYDAWYRKLQAKPEHIKFLVQFGGGRISGKLPPLQPGQENKITWAKPGGGTATGTMEQFCVEVLKAFASGRVACLPPGGEVIMHHPSSKGEVFELAFDRFDREMVLAFLKQIRATMEAKHGSKADSGTANDLLDSVVNYLRKALCSCLMRQMIRPLVELNWGVEIAKEFTPWLSLDAPPQEDFAATASAIQSIQPMLKTPEQVNWAESKLGMPESDGIAEEPVDDEPKLPFSSSKYEKSVRSLWSKGSGLIEKFQAGKIDRDTFVDRFLTNLTEAHTQAAIEGARASGKKSYKLSQDDKDRIEEIVAEQAEYLEEFADRIAGDPEGAAHLGHGRMYHERARGTAGEFFVRTAPDDETFDWILGGGDHCEDCPRYASLSPYAKDEIAWYPGSCDSACLTNCNCRLVRSDGAEAPLPLDLD